MRAGDGPGWPGARCRRTNLSRNARGASRTPDRRGAIEGSSCLRSWTRPAYQTPGGDWQSADDRIPHLAPGQGRGRWPVDERRARRDPGAGGDVDGLVLDTPRAHEPKTLEISSTVEDRLDDVIYGLSAPHAIGPRPPTWISVRGSGCIRRGAGGRPGGLRRLVGGETRGPLAHRSSSSTGASRSSGPSPPSTNPVPSNRATPAVLPARGAADA